MTKLEEQFLDACGDRDIDAINACIKQGVDINVQNKINDTALIQACRDGEIDVVEVLVEAGANLDIQNIETHTALMIACLEGYPEIVDILLSYKANTDIQDRFGATALILATKYEEINMMDSLIENGADVNIQDKEGNTALIYACLCVDKYTEIIETLLNAGANMHLKNINRKTALELSKEIKDNNEIVQFLENYELTKKITKLDSNYEFSI